MLNTRERQEKFGDIIYNPKNDRFSLNIHKPKDYERFLLSELSAPLTLHWIVTMKCNARCKYCYERDFLLGVNDIEELLSKEQITRFLKDFSNTGGFRIYLTGGEPTLNPNLSFIVQNAYSYGLKSVVNSNGIAFPEEVYETMKRCESRLSLSLDSHIKESHNRTRNQNSYDSIIKLVDRAVGDGVDLRIISVLQDTNPKYWLEFGQFLRERNVRNWFIQSLAGSEPPSDLEKILTFNFPLMKIRVLPAIFDSFVYILPNGLAAGDLFHNRNIYGDVKTDAIKEIWKKDPKKTIKDYLGLLHINFRGERK